MTLYTALDVSLHSVANHSAMPPANTPFHVSHTTVRDRGLRISCELQGALLAGAIPALSPLRMADAAETFEATPGQPIVVEGLVAGQMRLSHLRGMQKGGVHCGVAGGPSNMSSFAGLLRFFDQYGAEAVHAKSIEDICRARADGKISNVFCWQSADALGASFNSPLGASHPPLRAFHEVGLRIIGLCYNVANQFGAGCLEPAVGHTGEQTSLDAIAMSPGVPVICTHTNVGTIAENPRCVSDRVIDAVARSGGVIGLSAVNDFHILGKGNTGKVSHIDQYEYIRNRVGIDHVGIASDFVDGMPIPYGGSINKEIIPAHRLCPGILETRRALHEIDEGREGVVKTDAQRGSIRLSSHSRFLTASCRASAKRQTGTFRELSEWEYPPT